MPPKPVERLTLLGIGAPLPWELFPAKMQARLQALDANQDGELTLGMDSASAAEVVQGQESFHQLYRLLWGFAGASPHNDRQRDRASLPDRKKAIESLQDTLFQKAVLPSLGKNPTAEQFRSAQALLELSADFRHLHSLGIEARGRYAQTKDLAFARAADNLQSSARRFASEVRAGLDHFNAIQAELDAIRPILDQAEEEEFRRAITRPYLIGGGQSPITGDAIELDKDGKVYFAVAVPQRYLDVVKKRGEKVEDSLVHHFNSIDRPWARIPAEDPDRPGKQFLLVAASAEQDAPGPEDDPIVPTSSFHLDQERLNRTLFRGHEVVYYRVGFRMPSARNALGKHRIRSFDLALDLGREIPRSFVLQDLSQGPSRTLLLSDTHMMEREWEIQPVMVSSLLNSLADGDSAAGEQAEAVDRFYLPNNELVLGLLEATNSSYRKSQIDRVIVSGDLIDSVNDPISTEALDYGKTNVRSAAWIFSKLQAPLHVVTGNHDHVGPTKPKSVNAANFVFQDTLRPLFKEHYDSHRYKGSLLWNAIKRTATQPCPQGDDACFVWNTLKAANSDGLHSPPADGFLAPQLRHSPYETYGLAIGHGFRLFGWPTEDEHLNYGYYLLEEAEDPVRQDIAHRGMQYLKKISPNGKGPQPKNFLAWLLEMRAAEEQGWRLLPFGHYPVFARDHKNHQVELDMMAPRTAWAVRQVAYFYRFAANGPVMPLFIAGHEHHYEATVFDLDFSALTKKDPEEAERLKALYLEELGKILRNPKPDSIYEKLDELRQRWHLDDILVTQSAGQAGENGYPDPLVEEFNRDSRAFGKKYGTLFLTVPAAGPPTDSHTGSVALTAHPEGRLSLETFFHRVGPDQEFIQVPGKDLESFRRAWWKEARAWDPSLEMKAFEARQGRTQVHAFGPRGYRKDPLWEFLPLVYQYPKGKIGIQLNLDTSYGYRDGEFASGLGLGGELRFPLAHRAHLNLGGPNYLAFGGKYDFLRSEPAAFVGLDWGLLRSDLTAERPSPGDWFFGARALLHSVLPGEPGIGLSAAVNSEGDWRLSLSLNFSLTLFTRRPKDSIFPLRP